MKLGRKSEEMRPVTAGFPGPRLHRWSVFWASKSSFTIPGDGYWPSLPTTKSAIVGGRSTCVSAVFRQPMSDMKRNRFSALRRAVV